MSRRQTGLSSLIAALRDLDIRFLIGGSVASSAHGVSRSTMDVDILAAVELRHLDALVDALGAQFYLDRIEMREAIEAHRSFNLIHQATSFKYDLFPARSAFEMSELDRARDLEFDFFGDRIRCPVASIEDILVAKLDWYKRGGCVSERQWNDIRGLVSAGNALDRAYAEKWASWLGVSDLLRRALEE